MYAQSQLRQIFNLAEPTLIEDSFLFRYARGQKTCFLKPAERVDTFSLYIFLILDEKNSHDFFSYEKKSAAEGRRKFFLV